MSHEHDALIDAIAENARKLDEVERQARKLLNNLIYLTKFDTVEQLARGAEIEDAATRLTLCITEADRLLRRKDRLTSTQES